MKIFSTNTIKVPHDIASVTRIGGGEVAAELAASAWICKELGRTQRHMNVA